MAVKRVSILGSTGSVGRSTVDVIRAQPEGTFAVEALCAQTNVDLLASQAVQLKAQVAAIGDESLYGALKDRLAGTEIEAVAGRSGVIEVSGRPCDIAVAAIVGFAGLEPVMRAIEAGAHVAIANKEPLVAAGKIVMAAAQAKGVRLLPVDSEHNAVFQVFDEGQRGGIERIILTASGGPFRTWDMVQMQAATPEQAIAHPNWSMGRKISVDSASMVNKALEVIEAAHLFDMTPKKIDVLVHPQSIVHSMVEYCDGSVLAQMGAPDMRTPIAFCLGWPDRIVSGGQRLDFSKIAGLTFEEPDLERFPAIRLAYECLRDGVASCAAFNAANEVAVAAFLEKRISFIDIVAVIAHILDRVDSAPLHSIADTVAFDEFVREQAQCYVDSLGYKKEVSFA